VGFTDYCHRFHFAADMNGDRAFTVTDVWLWAETVFRLPALLVAWTFGAVPETARFFEIDCGTGQGSGGAVFSAAVWFFAVAIFFEHQ
jgi:hypothetical protein